MPAPWIKKSVRQLVASMRGPPTTTPSAGDAASTALHTPATEVRSWSGNAFIMSASADGPVEEAKAWATMRAPISNAALGAAAVTNDMIAAPVNPMRYIRRCPWRSPSFPAIGVKTAKASSGPAITQVTVLVVEPRSSAMSGKAAERTVIVNELAATPISATTWITRGEYCRAGGSRKLTESRVGERSFTSASI